MACDLKKRRNMDVIFQLFAWFQAPMPTCIISFHAFFRLDDVENIHVIILVSCSMVKTNQLKKQLLKRWKKLFRGIHNLTDVHMINKANQYDFTNMHIYMYMYIQYLSKWVSLPMTANIDWVKDRDSIIGWVLCHLSACNLQ